MNSTTLARLWPDPDPPGPEADLVRLLCGTQDRRDADRNRAVELARHADPETLITLLRRVNLVALIGGRVLELGVSLGAEFSDAVEDTTRAARDRGNWFDLVTLAALASLDEAGIRAMPIKGSALARSLYGDAGLRTSVDIDLLVTSADLPAAVEALARLGWQPERTDRARLPILHETLIGRGLPRLELHWRVHWYETRFGTEALLRAQSPAPGEPLRMQRSDELAAMLLFYQRDGFSGLRTPADIATWWSVNSPQVSTATPLADVPERYSELAAALTVACDALRPLVGVPFPGRPSSKVRSLLAVRLTNPFLSGDVHRLRADASLIELLLSPSRGHVSALIRIMERAPKESDTAPGASGRRSTAVGHVTRMVIRWALSCVAILTRAVLDNGHRRRHL